MICYYWPTPFSQTKLDCKIPWIDAKGSISDPYVKQIGIDKSFQHIPN